MPSPSANPTPITPPRVPLIDQRTGLIDRAWYMFFLSMFNAAQLAVDSQNLGPSALSLTASLDGALRTLAQSVETAPDIASVAASLDEALRAVAQIVNTGPPLASSLVSEVAELSKQVQGLLAAPIYTPDIPQRRYGSFYDTTTQTAAAINTAYAMTFNTTDLSVGVYLGSPTSRVYVDRAGVYNIQFSAQLDNTSGGNHLAYIWFRVNGTDVTNSASQVRLKGNDGELVAAWNFLYNFNAGDYFELMWSVSDTSVTLTAVAAAAPVPGVPSVILTVTDNISNG